MRKKILFIFLMGMILAAQGGCKRSPHTHEEIPAKTPGGQEILAYTCSMHPFIRQKEPGRCPVCGMDLVPVYAEAPAGQEGRGMESQPAMVSGRTSLNLSEEKQQLIGVKTALVEQRPLIREIEASGRVAYDPELFVAQSDYLIARRTGGGDLGGMQGGLTRAARSRLLLLGMSEAQIRDLERRGKAQGSLVVPQGGEEVWIYASLFESDFPFVKPGTAVEVVLPNTGSIRTTEVASIDPVVNSNTRTAQARFKISNSEGELRPDMFVTARLKADLGQVLALPEGAVLDTGKRQLVYVKTGEGRFTPREIKIGRRGTDFAEVLEGLSAGDQVVTQGAFLIDSESSLKAGLSGGGGHKH